MRGPVNICGQRHSELKEIPISAIMQSHWNKSGPEALSGDADSEYVLMSSPGQCLRKRCWKAVSAGDVFANRTTESCSPYMCIIVKKFRSIERRIPADPPGNTGRSGKESEFRESLYWRRLNYCESKYREVGDFDGTRQALCTGLQMMDSWFM